MMMMMRSFLSRPSADSKRGSVVLPLLLALFAVSSSVLAMAEPVVHTNNKLRRSRQLLGDVPFYVKQDNQGNLVAVIQYGSDQDSQDQEETEILVPCSTDSTTSSTGTGPGVVLCQDLGGGHYQLVLPFHFERDANGVIVAVIFDDTVQKVPFHTELNQDGSVSGITCDAEDLSIPFYHRYDPNDGTITDVVYISEGEERQEEKLSGCATVGIVLACAFVAVLLGSLCVMHSFWCGVGCRSRKNDQEIGEDAEGTSGTKLGGEEEHDTETLASDDEEDKSSNSLEEGKGG